jgi:hypothetical protein
MCGTVNAALLLRNLPQAPFTLAFVDARSLVFYEEPEGYGVFPKNSRVTGATLLLRPGRNAQVDLLYFNATEPVGNRALREGAAGIWWW